jgi:hypothetical protein
MRHILTLCLAILTVLLAFVDPALAGFCAFGTVATHMFGDGNLKVTKALPAGASAVTTDGIDTGEGTTGTQITPMEFLLEVPALLTGVLGDAATMKYDVVTSASSDMSGDLQAIKWAGWGIVGIVFCCWAGWLSLLTIRNTTDIETTRERVDNHFEALSLQIADLKATILSKRVAGGTSDVPD